MAVHISKLGETCRSAPLATNCSWLKVDFYRRFPESAGGDWELPATRLLRMSSSSSDTRFLPDYSREAASVYETRLLHLDEKAGTSGNCPPILLQACQPK